MASKKKKNWKSELFSTAILVLAVLALKSSIAGTYVIPTGSMIPTILPGDRILSDQRMYGLRIPFSGIHLTDAKNPKRGDIVVFPSPIEDKTLIKRVVAIPGDVIEVHDGVITLNGKKSATRFIQGEGEGHQLFTEDLDGFVHPIQLDPRRPNLREMSPLQIPEGYFFAMGDNRDNSADSRYFGKVSVSEIKGKALRILWSFQTETAPYLRLNRFGHTLY